MLAVYCTCPAASAAEHIRKDFRKTARRYRFKIRQDAQLPSNIGGTVLSAKAAEKELVNFFDALDDLGSSFVKKSGLKQVIICRNLKLNGMVCAGVARGDCMYLSQGATKKIIYHELFHIFDPKRQNKEWTKLNDSRFRYWGIDFPDRPASGEKRHALAEYYRNIGYKFAVDFVSNYAQTSEVEDRAETFAAMVNEGAAFLERTKKSTVLYNKMLFIINLTNRSSLLGRNFWNEKLGCRVDELLMQQKKR